MAEEIGPFLDSILATLPKAKPTVFHIPKNVFDLESLSINLSADSAKRNGISTTETKKVAQQWERLIPKLKALRSLFIGHKTSQPLLESVCKLTDLKELSIDSSNISDLTPIMALRHLSRLNIKNSPKLKSITPLASLTSLRSLSIENAPIKEVGSLETLVNLEDLRIAGGLWKTLKVETLQPIQRLKRLNRLALPNLRTVDKDIRGLGCLKNLEALQLAMWWPREDYEYLESALPKLKTVSWKKL